MRLFSWVSDVSGASNRLSHRLDREFGDQLFASLPFVFHAANGSLEKLPPDEYRGKRYFDDSRAMIDTPALRLRLQKGRGDLTVQAASPKQPFEWQEITSLLTWVDRKQNLPKQQYPYFNDSDLSKLDDFLRANWSRLQGAVEMQEL